MTTYIPPIAITTAGIGGTVAGALHLANGHIAQGVGAVFLGMTITNLGGRFQGIDPTAHSEFMKYTLALGTTAIGMQGASRFKNGMRKKNADEITKGVIQTATGIAGTAFVCSLDSKIIVVAHQASAIALSSFFVGKLGFNDLAKGRYLPGLCKIALGLGGMASAGYYAYSACSQLDALSPDQIPWSKDQGTLLKDYKENASSVSQMPLSEDRIAFLEAHKAEIDEMYEEKKSVGKWKTLGEGSSKTAFEHPDLPGMLIKIPGNFWGYRECDEKWGENNLRLHHANLQEIRKISPSFDRIVLPESHLYPTPKGPILVEEKLDLISYDAIPTGPDKQETEDQYYAFREAADLCDLNIRSKHNAGFLSQTTPPKIGVIDFDCIFSKITAPCRLRKGNFEDPPSRFFIPENRNKIASLVLAAGTTVMGGIAAVAKKISRIKPRTVLQLGLGIGAVTATVLAFQEGFFQPAASIAGAGITMAATAVVTIAAPAAYSATAKAYSWVTRSRFFG